MMEPISELVDRTGGSQTSLLALLQILYEIEQCEKERKVVQTVKNPRAVKGAKENDKKKQRSKSPPKGKDVTSKKSSESVKEKLKTPKAVKDLIDAAKGIPSVPTTDIQVKTDQTTTEERSVEELLADLCFLLLMDPQIVRRSFCFVFKNSDLLFV